MKKTKPIIKREFWGAWEDRSDKIKFYPNVAMRSHIKQAFRNLVLSAQVSLVEVAWGEITHLWLRRHDQQPLLWRDIQRAKRELGYAQRLAVEVFPADDDVVDQANMYHLWILPDGFTLPFSLKTTDDAKDQVAA